MHVDVKRRGRTALIAHEGTHDGRIVVGDETHIHPNGDEGVQHSRHQKRNPPCHPPKRAFISCHSEAPQYS